MKHDKHLYTPEALDKRAKEAKKAREIIRQLAIRLKRQWPTQ